MIYDNVRTVADLVNAAAKEHGDKFFIRYEKDDVVKDVTYTEFLDLCQRVAKWTEEKNSTHGQNIRIGILGISSKPFLAALMGIMTNGNIAISLDVQMNLDTLVDCINRADIDYLFYNWDFLENVEAAQELCPNLKGTVCLQNRKHVECIYKIWKSYDNYQLKDMNIIFDDINALYRGEELSKQSYTMYEYILDEQERIRLGKRQECINNFTKMMDNLKIKKSILNRNDFHDLHKGETGIINGNIEGLSKRVVQAFCKRNNVSENVFFLTAFNYCISIFANDDDVVCTSTHSGRTDSRWYRVIGPILSIVSSKGLTSSYASIFKSITCNSYMRIIIHHLFKRKFTPSFNSSLNSFKSEVVITPKLIRETMS